MLKQLFSPLRSYRFTLLFLGETISDVGNRCYEVILVWLITGLTGSSVLLGAVLTAEFIPLILLQVIGGVWADRIGPYRTVLVSDLLRTVVTFVFAVLVTLGYISIIDVVLFSVFYGLVSAFFNPSMTVLMISLVSSEDYHAYSSLSQLLGQLTLLLGPALGGYLIARFNVGIALAFDACTFAISFVAIILIRQRQTKTVTQEASLSKNRQGIAFTDVFAGFQFLWQKKGIFILVLLASLVNGLNNVETVLVPILARFELKLSAAQFGLLATFLGLGALVGSFGMGMLGKGLRRKALVIYLCIFVFGSGIVVMGGAQTVWQLYGAYFVLGVTFAIIEVLSSTLLLQAIPEEVRGRAFSVVSTLSMALNPLGFLFAGLLGAIWGARVGLWIGGGAIVVLSIVAFLFPMARSLDKEISSKSLDIPQANTEEFVPSDKRAPT